MADNDFLLQSFPNFPDFKSKVCSQAFSTYELEVDFLSDLVILKYFFFS